MQRLYIKGGCIWDRGLKCCLTLGARASPHWVWPNPGWEARMMGPWINKVVTQMHGWIMNYMHDRSSKKRKDSLKNSWTHGCGASSLFSATVSTFKPILNYTLRKFFRAEKLSFSTTTPFYISLPHCAVNFLLFKLVQSIPLSIYQLHHGRNPFPIPTELYLYILSKQVWPRHCAFVIHDQ